MNPSDQEKLTIGWVIAAILGYMAQLHTAIVVLLIVQTIISIIATIINSYKHHGTKKRKVGRKTRS